MRGVGHETAHALEGLVEPREQLVERGGEDVQLVGGAADIEARVEISRRNFARLPGHRAEWSETARGQPIAANSGEREQQGQPQEKHAADNAETCRDVVNEFLFEIITGLGSLRESIRDNL